MKAFQSRSASIPSRPMDPPGWLDGLIRLQLPSSDRGLVEFPLPKMSSSVGGTYPGDLQEAGRCAV